MKKMKLFAICLCVGLCVTACGNANTDSTVENAADTAITTEVDENTEETDADEKDVNEVVEDTEESSDEDVTVATENDVENTSDEDVEEAEDNTAEVVALADIYAQIQDEVELVSPMEPGADFIYNFFGIEVSEYEEYVFEMSDDPVSAEAIIMVRTNGSDQTDSAKASLESYLEEKGLELQDYLPEEYDIVADSEVVIKGDYVYLVVSHNASDITAIIENNL